MKTKICLIVLLIIGFVSTDAVSQTAKGKLKSVNLSKKDKKSRGVGDPLKGLNLGDSPMVIGDYYALIIGIDNYKGAWESLNNATHDAKAVEKLLRENYNFDHFRTLYNEEATRIRVIKELEFLVNNAKETDNIFIFYSGHGDFDRKLDRGYWVPVDATTKSISSYISNTEIQDFLGGINSKHTLLISDACFSGDIFRGKTVTIDFEDSDRYFRTIHNLMSRNAMTSGDIEPVMDGGRDGHSVFAYYLLKALRQNNRKFFDANQLFERLKIPVINNSSQTPRYHPLKNTGDEGGQFIFIKK